MATNILVDLPFNWEYHIGKESSKHNRSDHYNYQDGVKYINLQLIRCCFKNITVHFLTINIQIYLSLLSSYFTTGCGTLKILCISFEASQDKHVICMICFIFLSLHVL